MANSSSDPQTVGVIVKLTHNKGKLTTKYTEREGRGLKKNTDKCNLSTQGQRRTGPRECGKRGENIAAASLSDEGYG